MACTSGIVRAGEQSVWLPGGIRDSEGWLAADFLLLTVIPTSRTFGGYVALASGAHGPGTGAFGLLANRAAFRLRDLENLLDHPAVKNQRAYQIVFEAKVERGKYSIPTELRVSEAMPPRSIDVSQGIFKSASDEENWEAIQRVLATAAAGE